MLLATKISFDIAFRETTQAPYNSLKSGARAGFGTYSTAITKHHVGAHVKSGVPKVKKPFIVALVQMHVVGGNRERNLENAERLIAEAASQGADLALLPECMDLGWTHPASKTDAQPIPDGETCQRLMTAARQNNIFVCSGLVEKADDKVYNAAVLIDAKGELLLTHRKLNELGIGHEYYAQGDRLNVCHTSLGTLGLMICADGVAQDAVLTRSLGYMGADVILSPSAWAVPPDFDNQKTPYGQLWRDAYRPVAEDFALWIISVSNVGALTAGPWAEWDCIGNSIAFAPDGKEKLTGPFGVDAETILYLDVLPRERPARGTDWHKRWNTKKSTV